MKKIATLVVILAVIWAIPPLRARFLLAIAPALEQLGPVGERMLTPARRFSTNNEISFIIRQMEIYRDERRSLPTGPTFTEWLRENTTSGRDGTDPWGRPYYLVRGQGTVTVGSTGPDGERGNEDDVKQTVSF